MEMMLLQKFDWKIDDATAIDMLFALFDLSSGPGKVGPGYQQKNLVAHFLASELTRLVVVLLISKFQIVVSVLNWHTSPALSWRWPPWPRSTTKTRSIC